MTLLSRKPAATHRVEMRFMWAYREMITGNPYWRSAVLQNIENILFFIPFGFFAPVKMLKKCLVFGVAFSVIIEITQYFAYLGLCELDDIICNGLGTMIGFILYKKIESIVKRKMGSKTK